MHLGKLVGGVAVAGAVAVISAYLASKPPPSTAVAAAYPLTAKRLTTIPPNPSSSWRAIRSGMCCAMPKNDRGEVRVFLTGAVGATHKLSIGWIDLDRDGRIIAESKEPVLKIDTGALMPCVVDRGDGEWWMYYSSNGNQIASSRDQGETWTPLAQNILRADPAIEDVAGTCVVVRSDEGWRLFYTSVVGWTFGETKDTREKYEDSRFVIRFAESSNGIQWTRPADSLALDSDPNGTSARPCVWREGERWLMLYCRAPQLRHGFDREYRIHLAGSADGRKFTDAGEVLLPSCGTKGFDSDRCEYPWYIGGGKFLYSGNGFGRSGMGIAQFTLPR